MARREMFALAAIACLPALLAVGCGSGLPSDETVYHDPALRPGVVPADDPADREILSRLAQLTGEGAIDLGGHSVHAEAPYAAASGRRCRRVVDTAHARLACEAGDRSWVFVPNVLSTDVGVEQ